MKIKDPWDSNSYAMYTFERRVENKRPTWIGYLYWLTWVLRHSIAVLICKHRGHKYHIEGHANGDTGGDYATCTRCGHSWSHIYY